MVGVGDPDFRSYQLYVPDAPLNTVSELGQISIFAHVCLDHNLKDVGSWQTVSEQMYLAHERSVGGSTVPDPYMGVLDPTRNLYGSTLENPMGSALQIPENLTIPLATRVYDCFEVLNRRNPSRKPSEVNDMQGVINVNTASARVLEMLPFMKPRIDYLAGASGTFLPSGVGNLSKRANTIIEYRDRIPSLEADMNSRPGIDFTGVGNGSGPDMIGLGMTLRESRDLGAGGISAIGELSILDSWDVVTGNPVSSANNLFATLGANGVNDGAPPPLAAPGTALLFPGNFLDLTPSAIGLLPTSSEVFTLNPVDDPEERNTMFRAISNIVTTRSDVFIAWFVVRGYDPDKIERIDVDIQDREQSLADDLFRPDFDRRYLCVFDRSNVRTPTDRPKLLLRFRLPDATP